MPGFRRFHAIVGALLLAITLAGGMLPVAARGQSANEVVSHEFVELDGMRPIGLSPDGAMLAAADLGAQLCIYETGDFTEISCASLDQLEASLRISDVTWSPDGTRLVLSEESFIYFKDGDLWLMEVDTGTVTNLADDGYSGALLVEFGDMSGTITVDASPAWTPDGSAVTVSRSTWTDGTFAGNELVSIPAAGIVPISHVLVDPERPGIAYHGMEWTPDGRHLYYTFFDLSDPDNENNGIHRYDATTGETEHIVVGMEETGPPALLQLGATGTQLVVWFPYLAGRMDGPESIYAVYDLETGKQTPIAAANEDGIVTAVGISPREPLLLVGTHTFEKNFELWLRDLITGEQTMLIGDLPGATVMDFGMALWWADDGSVFVPAGIGSGTFVQIDSPSNVDPARTRNSD